MILGLNLPPSVYCYVITDYSGISAVCLRFHNTSITGKDSNFSHYTQLDPSLVHATLAGLVCAVLEQ